MSNPLFDLFINFKSAKVIWTKLETKYGSNDAGKRKYVVGKWLQFLIFDDKPIMEQVHVYENLCAEVLAEGMKMCEILQADVLIKKIFPFWSDYRNHLKYKKKDLTLQELISYMRSEEANRLKDKMSSLSLNSVNSNLVESAVPTNKDKFKGKGKKFQKPSQNLRNQNSATRKIQKPKVVCYVCGKLRHKAYQCNQRKGSVQAKPKSAMPTANIAETDNNEIICAVTTVETNLVHNLSEWILNSGASRHVCANKELMIDFEEVADGQCVFMGNSSTAAIKGKGKILLKFTSGKILSLSNVLFVPSLRRNLVSSTLLDVASLKNCARS